MTGEQAYDAAERFANNAYLLVLARAAMLACSLAGPPLAYWVIRTTNETANTLLLVQRDVQYNADLRNAEDQRLRNALEQLRTEMRERTQDRYRTEDAVKDFRLRDLRLDQHDRRIDTLERQPRP